MSKKSSKKKRQKEPIKTRVLSWFKDFSGHIEGLEKFGEEKVQKISKSKILNSKKAIHPILSFILGIIFTICLFFIPYQVFVWFKNLPSPDLLQIESGGKSTMIYDRNGVLLYEVYVDKKYAPVKLAQIPELLKKATIAVEDETFYTHHGIRPESIIRAAHATLFKKELQGGSTITQQLIKNVLLSPERTISRKIKEVILSLLVETKYTKDQILEMYLNNISYGGTAWGIEAASQKYYGKDVWELDLAEISMLVGLPSAPSTYSPLSNLELAKQRQQHVLDRMYSLNIITKQEKETAFEEELFFAQHSEYIKAPHFVEFVRSELERMYGKRFVDFGGLSVVTTLDLPFQEKVQRIVREGVDASKNLNISNGAAVVLDTKKAEILAHVGSLNYYQPGWGAYDVATALRQPGSSVKPVTYALALSRKDFTPATVIQDSPVSYQIVGSKPYTPVNYDGQYHGNVTLRSALANSYNIPAVRLAKVLGPDNIVSLGKEMGETTWEVDGNYGLSITLGGKEVRLLDHTNVFATFGRGGIYRPVTPFLSIKDTNGYEIYNNSYRDEKRVLGEEASYLIWHILSDDKARLPAFGTRNFLTVPNQIIAVKTGTTDEKRDNWTLGFTPSYAVGVWVGNNNNQPMNKYLASGLSGAAPIWNNIFAAVLEGKIREEMKRPDGVFAKVDPECGGRQEVFVKGSNVPAHLCVIEKKDDEDKDNEKDKKDKKDD